MMDKKRSSKQDIYSIFTWGGTNPVWEIETKILSQKLEEKNKTKEKDNKNDHYYLRDHD